MPFFHMLSEDDYKEHRFRVMVAVEEKGVLKPDAYVDSSGHPTIGLGVHSKEVVQ